MPLSVTLYQCTIRYITDLKKAFTMTPKDYKDIVYNIIGAAMEVHSELKWGLLEPIYNEALCLELMSRGIDCDKSCNKHRRNLLCG